MAEFQVFGFSVRLRVDGQDYSLAESDVPRSLLALALVSWVELLELGTCSWF